MKLWILVAVALLLLAVALWSESFTATPSIKAPPYDAAEKIRIFGMANNADQATLRAAATATVAASTPNREQKIQETAGGYISPAIEQFFTQKYAPANTPITQANVDAFVDALPTAEYRDIKKRVLKVYFVGQQGASTSSDYARILASEGQGAGYGGAGPTGAAASAAGPAGPTGPTASASGPASGPTGPALGPGAGPVGGPTGSAPPSTGSPTGPTSGGTTTTQGTPTTTGGSTTGYGTTFTTAPTQGLFGPQFTSFGDPSPSGNSLDSSKYTSYPQVLGGVPEKSTRTAPGAGVISGPRQLELPTMESLGSSAQAQFFPFSRTPGDLERIPDPYRVSQMFNTASYSSKTEPVPFLTDFSAFQR